MSSQQILSVAAFFRMLLLSNAQTTTPTTTVEPAYNGGGKSPILFRYEEVSVINLVCPIQITPVKSANSFRYREVSVIIRSVISRFYCSGTSAPASSSTSTAGTTVYPQYFFQYPIPQPNLTIEHALQVSTKDSILVSWTYNGVQRPPVLNIECYFRNISEPFSCKPVTHLKNSNI